MLTLMTWDLTTLLLRSGTFSLSSWFINLHLSAFLNDCNYSGIPVYNEAWHHVRMVTDWNPVESFLSASQKMNTAIQSRLRFASANSISVCNWFGCVANSIRTQWHTRVNKIRRYCCLPLSHRIASYHITSHFHCCCCWGGIKPLTRLLFFRQIR